MIDLIDSLRQDFLYALRGFRREAGFAIVAMLILALGIGANTAVFSIVNPLLLRPLPFPGANELVWLAPDPARSAKKSSGMSDGTYTVAVYELLQRESRSFANLSAYNAFFGYGNNTLGDATMWTLITQPIVALPCPWWSSAFGVTPMTPTMPSCPTDAARTAVRKARTRRSSRGPRAAPTGAAT